MSERRLELTCTEACGRTDGIVNPRLLKHVGTCGCSIDAEVIIETSKGLTREAQYGIGHSEARIGHIVLIIGFVESLVVVVIQLSAGLEEQIWFEDEPAVLAL